jgi:NAD(P)-dependent dehydrogenase (short-subunit alcohol dehydrogenase family)
VGHVTMLINNAGVATGGYFLQHSDDDIQRTINTNLLAHFWVLVPCSFFLE